MMNAIWNYLDDECDLKLPSVQLVHKLSQKLLILVLLVVHERFEHKNYCWYCLEVHEFEHLNYCFGGTRKAWARLISSKVVMQRIRMKIRLIELEIGRRLASITQSKSIRIQEGRSLSFASKSIRKHPLGKTQVNQLENIRLEKHK